MKKIHAVSGTLKCLCVMIGLFLICSVAEAQNSREYIRNAIKGWGSCRNVTITKSNGDMALYGRNGWAQSGCPSGLTNAISKLNNDKEYINDVQLTERGNYVILYGDNGIMWDGIPYSLERKLREYNSDQQVITSVTFNDSGDWIVVTKQYYSSSDSDINDWLKEGHDKYGQLWTVCVTDDALVAVYETGFQFLGNVPEDLKTALQKATFDVMHVKIAGTAWFFSDDNGHYRYNM